MAPREINVTEEALAGCSEVVRARAEGHLIERVRVAPEWAKGSGVTVMHGCASSFVARTRPVKLEDRGLQAFKVGDFELAVRVIAGYCPKCHTLVCSAVEVDRRPYRKREGR